MGPLLYTTATGMAPGLNVIFNILYLPTCYTWYTIQMYENFEIHIVMLALYIIIFLLFANFQMSNAKPFFNERVHLVFSDLI